MWDHMATKKSQIVEIRESEIQTTILQWLKVAGYYAWKVPLGPMAVRGGKDRSRPIWKSNPMAGFPDIQGLCKNRPGRMFVIEVKSRKGRLSDKQKVWLTELENRGVVTIVARDLATVIEILKARDIPWTSSHPA